MSRLGLGVMIAMLHGSQESARLLRDCLNQRITALALVHDALRIGFSNGRVIDLKDDGQSCCEARYMRTDDVLDAFVGAHLTNVRIENAEPDDDTKDEYAGEHEVQFLIIDTSRGSFTMASHVEHNGYYGGFAIVAVEVKGKEDS